MKLVTIDEEKLTFDDGTMITYDHYQDCCEHVYADFKQLQDTSIWDEDFDELVIEGVPDSGLRVNGYFIPCYNNQNGYYSSGLELIVTHPNSPKITIDISEYVEDQIW